MNNLEMAFSCRISKNTPGIKELLESYGILFETGKKNYKLKRLSSEQVSQLLAQSIPLKRVTLEKKTLEHSGMEPTAQKDLLTPGRLFRGGEPIQNPAMEEEPEGYPEEDELQL